MRLLALLAFTGCLYESSSPGNQLPWPLVDAGITSLDGRTVVFDAPIDAPIDAPSAMTYAEQQDLGNDYNYGGIEQTGLVFVYGVPSLTITGFINPHYDATYGTIDVDNFSVAIPDPGRSYITTSGSGLAALPSVTLQVWSDQLDSVIGSDVWMGESSYTPFDAESPGAYEIGIAAFGSAATPIVDPIPYTIVVRPELDLF